MPYSVPSMRSRGVLLPGTPNLSYQPSACPCTASFGGSLEQGVQLVKRGWARILVSTGKTRAALHDVKERAADGEASSTTSGVAPAMLLAFCFRLLFRGDFFHVLNGSSRVCSHWRPFETEGGTLTSYIPVLEPRGGRYRPQMWTIT